MNDGIRASRESRESRRNGGRSRMAMGFAMVVIALIVAALLFIYA
jgi:hypothetical protein